MRLLTLILTLFLPGALMAEPWSCHFTAVCVAEGDCQEADLPLEITRFDHERQIYLLTPGAARPVQESPRRGTTTALAASYRDGAVTLWIEADGIAKYIVWPSQTGPQFDYFGTCQEL